MKKIAIIGAGAGGVFTAINAKNENNEISIFDKNEKICKKLYITGKGRCNITNAKLFQDFLDNIVINKKFLYSSFSKFDNFSLMDYFETRGLKLVIQRGDRVFPKSEKSSDVIKFFKKQIEDKKINLYLNEEVTEISKKDDRFILKTNNNEYFFDKVVIATGGISYPATGSTGDGYRFAKKFNHNIVQPVASLVPIKVKDKDIIDLEGISLKNISLNIKTDKNNYSEFGDLLFAKSSISGPVVLTLSSLINRQKVDSMSIDLKPGLSYEKLDLRILRDFRENPNLDIGNNLKKLLLNAFIPVILNRTKIDIHKKCNQVSKEEREKLLRCIKEFNLDFDSLEKISRAVVTSGGIDVKEIDPKTMESKLIKDLYFVGEVIDIDAFTGGFNLQIAFSTAYQCASNLKEN